RNGAEREDENEIKVHPAANTNAREPQGGSRSSTFDAREKRQAKNMRRRWPRAVTWSRCRTIDRPAPGGSRRRPGRRPGEESPASTDSAASPPYRSARRRRKPTSTW